MSFRDEIITLIRGKSFIVKDGYKYNNEQLITLFDYIADTIENFFLDTEEVNSLLSQPKPTRKQLPPRPHLKLDGFANIYKNTNIADLPNEEWRDIKGYEGLYQVSSLGRIKSFLGKSPRILSQCSAGDRQPQVILCADGKKHKVYVSQIVGFTFCGMVDKTRNEVYAHINHCKTDNRAENITILSKGKQILLAYHDGVMVDWGIGEFGNGVRFIPTQLYIGKDKNGDEEKFNFKELRDRYGSGVRSIIRCITKKPDCKGYVYKTAYGKTWRVEQINTTTNIIDVTNVTNTPIEMQAEPMETKSNKP